jgi:aminocarboxymuconate-semialdehyde decarboxylase
MEEMRLSGVVITSTAQGVSLGDDRFRPFWEVAEGTGALVFIHPTTRGFALPALQHYYLWNAVGNPVETTIAASHLVMAAVMETHPRLKVLLAHGGGAIMALRGRLRHAWEVQPEARARLHESPERSLARFFFDSLTHDPAVLQDLIDAVGADHVLLGSDYPFDMGATHPAAMVRALHLPGNDEAKILGGNAARLLGIH